MSDEYRHVLHVEITEATINWRRSFDLSGVRDNGNGI
jgi:hypothetical protein